MLNLKNQMRCLVLSSLTFTTIASAEALSQPLSSPEWPVTASPTIFTEANQATPSPVLIFISFSMSPASLHQWAQQAKKIHAPLIIQGLLKHSFAKTQQAVAVLAQDNRSGVVLDSRLFREYKITQVPAVVVRRLNTQPCPVNQSCRQDNIYDVVSGDVGLEAALQQIADHGETADLAGELLAQWRQA